MKTKIQKLIVGLLVILLGMQATIPTIAQKNKVRKMENPYYHTTARISNKEEIVYEGLDTAEQLPRGPVSLSITDDGNFVVANQVENSAIEIASSGEIIQKVTFKNATTIGDAVKVGSEFFALDRNEEEPAILAFSTVTGETRKISNASPDAFRFTGWDNGTLNSGDVTRLTKIDGQNVNAPNAENVERGDQLKISPGNPFQTEPNRFRVWRGGKLLVEQVTDFPVAETRIIGSTGKGDFFIMVLELVGKTSLIFDQKILRFDSEGKLLGQARIPQEQIMPLDNDTALSADGNVFVLMPRWESLDILQLNFFEKLEPLVITEEKTGNLEATAQQTTSSLNAMTRSQIASIANSYTNSAAYINSISINGVCSGRVKPRYFGSANWYPSVPYSWGGSDNPSEFAAKMNLGNQSKIAGHAAGYYASCTPAGVDCSGFVGRAWGLSQHPFSTSSVVSSGYAYSIDWTILRQGDALNLAGTHIMLFDRSADANSAYVWEATTDADSRGWTDRAVYHTRTWSYLRSSYPYKPIRYSALSYSNPTARFSAISNRGIAYEGATAYYTVSPGSSITFNFDSSRSSANSGFIDGRYWKINGTLLSYAQSFNFTLGRGTHNVTLEITNSDGGRSTAKITIVITEVEILPPPSIWGILPSTVRLNTATWLKVTGQGFMQGLKGQIRTPAGGPWIISSGNTRYINSGEVWFQIVMGGAGSYTATLEIVNPNGTTARRNFSVIP